jgi:hypothetical protein
MAKFNEPQVGRFNRMAQKLLSMKGPATIDQVANDLRFVIPLPYGAENRYLESWDLFAVAVAMGAPGAGNLATGELRNPAGSNVIAVLMLSQIIDPTAGTSAAASNLTVIRGATADQNVVDTPIGFDLRGRGSPTLKATHNSAAQTAAGGTAGVVRFGAQPANVSQELLPFGQEIPMPPGTAVEVAPALTNTGMAYLFWWRERFLEDSERA